MIRALIAALLAFFLFPATLLAKPAKADLPFDSFDPRDFICPLGGKAFHQDVGYASFPLISMPDGSWLGDNEIGAQIPVCPDTGLVLLPDFAKDAAKGDRQEILYGEYSAAEIARLPVLIADPAYRALASEGRYAQAWWLATQLGRPAEDRFFMLQRSTWATRDPALRKLLVARFVTEAPAIIDAMQGSDMARRLARVHVANGLRELGRFDEAAALLDSIEASGPPAPGQPDPESMHSLSEAIGALRLAIAQRDDGRFAAAMLPDRMLDDICDGKLERIYGPTTASTKAACKQRRDAEQKEADDFEAALAMRDDKAALDARCTATPPERRDGALTKACALQQEDRDRIAGNGMTRHGAKLAADCATTPAAKRSGALFSACISLDTATERALGEQLAADAAAYTIVCPGDPEADLPDRSELANRGCQNAYWKLKNEAAAMLVADPARLDPMCGAKDADGYTKAQPGVAYEVLINACSTIASDRRTAEIERLATDPSAFDTACGRYRKTNAMANAVSDLTNEQEKCQRAWRLRENTRARTEATARGEMCFGDAIYSPERPRCLPKAAFDAETAANSIPSDDQSDPFDISMFDDGSSLMQAAHVRAATIIAQAKAAGTYPKHQPGDKN